MAVEKMHLVNITSKLDNLKDLLLDVVDIGQIEPIDAFNQVASRAFSVTASTENVELTEDMNNIKSFDGLSKSDNEKMTYLKKFLEIHDDENSNYNQKVISRERLQELYEDLAPLIKRREELLEKRKELLNFKANLEVLEKADIDINKIKELKYFDYRYGEVSKDGRFILKNNYENIPSLIIHLDSEAKKSADALNEIIELDKKTRIRREEVDNIIISEREESLKVASRIDTKYSNMIQDEIIKINSKYDGEIAEQSKKIKSDYNKLKDDISSIYNEEVDSLVDYAFDMVVKGD
ncbi:V-type ATP synthase subunit I domain-containing protein [Anaerococcus degeneri]|uniref:V-type ATP synthase subunit I n=1 Tax=Anaerococcus degeneri TaxID=361500 RepID=A0ABS7YUG0_9FIRM|nr:hypothetical protein [Anaerococcus degeneri]MBP2015104.1 glutaredoxin-related protein [Anaerococcus degeneri]MCA2095364.1 hypothetical protein [Anaerococcus degeneri]